MSKFLESFITDLKSARAIGRLIRRKNPDVKYIHVADEIYHKIADELRKKPYSDDYDATEAEVKGLVIRMEKWRGMP